MRTSALLSVAAAINAVSSNPTQTEKELPRRVGTLPVVTASGNAFYTPAGRFYIRGIDYQPGGSSANADPLADIKICSRDIPKFQELGVNTIRVYSVDNNKNHDACMKMLDDAKIYLVLDVNNPQYSINRDKPFESYNAQYLQSVFATIDEFAKYDNTMAFFSGNEVIDKINSTISAPYVKATTRDMKNYMTSRGLRKVPVGYSAADVTENRMQTAHYMNCGPDDAARSDFFAFNDYSWCNTDFATAGWDQKVKNFTDYGIPIFLSEYGCFVNGRDFNEIDALMSTKMTGVYSGGLMYEYSLEGNGFGIVKINGDSIEEQPEFKKLADAMLKFPAPSGSGGASTTSHSVPCPAFEAVFWEVDPSLLPTMPQQAEKYMKEGAGVGPGLKGPGSQDAGGSGTSTASTTGGAPSPSATKNVAPGGMTHPRFIETGPLLITGLTIGMTLFGVMVL